MSKGKKIVIILITALVLTSVFVVYKRSVDEHKKEDIPSDVVDDPKVDTEELDEDKDDDEVIIIDGESEEEGYPVRDFDDVHYLELEEKEFVVRLRDKDFIYGIKNSDAAHLWHFNSLGDYKYEVVNLPDDLINPEGAINEYVEVEKAYPEGLTFTVIEDRLTLRHGDEIIGVFEETLPEDFGGR